MRDYEESRAARELADAQDRARRLTLKFFQMCEKGITEIPGYYGHAIGPMSLKVYVYPMSNDAAELASSLRETASEWAAEHRHEKVIEVKLIIQENEAARDTSV